MTDRNKFEEMLERLINEDRTGAEELFHEIVVEKSREIYQAIIESEDEEEVDEAEDEEVDEASDDEELEESEDEEVDEANDDEDLDEMFGLDEFELEADPMSMMGGDATDDMMGDVGMDDMGGDDMGDAGMDDMGGDTDGRISDLEDALDALRAEFEAMMGDVDGDGDHDMDDHDAEDDDDEGDDEGDDEEDEAKEEFAFEAKKSEKKDEKKKTAGEQMREYVEKVAPAKMGDNGTNAKSIVASKNDMGGTTANIVKGGTEAGVEANKGHLKGSSLFKGTPKEDNAGNINVPGGKAGKTSFKKSEPGHGAERKGKPETADKSAGSTIRGVVRKG
jgi:hypothetical protein